MSIPKPTILIAVALFLLAIASTSNAQQSSNEEAEPQATRQAQAVGRDVYEVIEKSRVLVDEENFADAIDVLTVQIGKKGNTEYELANLYQYLGFCYHSAGDTTSAIGAFGQLLDIESIEESMRKRNLYTLAQLLSVDERYADSLARLDEWFDLETNPDPGAYIFYAQTLYQLDRPSEMIEPIETALAVAEERNTEAKEAWYSLLSFAYFQQENYAKIRDINELMLEKWPKKRYWLYLANAYRELNDEDKFFSSYDALYTQDRLESESELVTMAQLYLQQDVPYKAAMLLEGEMDRGRVAESAKNYRLLSQAWYLAKEDGRSIEPLETAATMTDDGNLYIRLANTYLNLAKNSECVAAARSGIKKGGLKNVDHAQISLGMCLYNIQEYGDALRAFREAAKTPRSRSIATQWISIINQEIRRNEQIAELLLY